VNGATKGSANLQD